MNPSPPLPPQPLADHLRIFTVLHGAMRRDVRRLSDVVARVPAHDGAALERLRRWYAEFRAALGHHHRLEDDHFWPAMRTHPDGPAIEAAMHHEHERLEAALDAVTAAFDEPVTLGPAVAALSAVLSEHLADEEATALVVLGEHLSAEAFATVDRQAHRDAGLAYVRFALPWIRDELPAADAAAIDDATPAVFRVLLRLWWQPRYRRLTRGLRP